MTDKQIQRAGPNSTLLQAQNVHYGISYTDARDIAIDVFRNNFMQLAHEAAEVAWKRVEQFTDQFFARLQEQYPTAIASAREPGMQRALYQAQVEVACSSDEGINDILTDVLVERANENQRSLRRIVLDEALLTIPKLTLQQMSTLSLAFYLTHVQHVGFEYSNALNKLFGYLRKFLEPLGDIASDPRELSHLEYAGCLSVSLASSNIASIFARRYPGIFCQGLTESSFEDRLRPAFVPHPSGNGRFTIPVATKDSLSGYLTQKGIAGDEERIWELIKAHRMADRDIVQIISDVSPRIRAIVKMWDDTDLKGVQLTSVGIAIGHANLRRLTEFPTGLEIWIP